MIRGLIISLIFILLFIGLADGLLLDGIIFNEVGDGISNLVTGNVVGIKEDISVEEDSSSNLVTGNVIRTGIVENILVNTSVEEEISDFDLGLKEQIKVAVEVVG